MSSSSVVKTFDVLANEWEIAIEKLSVKEREFYKLKEEYNNLSEKIISETDFKELYGRNNESVRKNHLRKELSEEYTILKEVELEIDYLKRYISF